MYERIARDLGFTFKSEPIYTELQHLPDMFLGYVIHSRNGLTTIAIGVDNLTDIVVVPEFYQETYGKKLLEKPIVFRRYEALMIDKQLFISADVSKVFTPAYGNMICKSHPRHGLTKKYAPIGKVYNERFCLLPIIKDYK